MRGGDNPEKGEMCVTREMEDYVRGSHVEQAAVGVRDGVRVDRENVCLLTEVKRLAGRAWNGREDVFGNHLLATAPGSGRAAVWAGRGETETNMGKIGTGS